MHLPPLVRNPRENWKQLGLSLLLRGVCSGRWPPSLEKGFVSAVGWLLIFQFLSIDKCRFLLLLTALASAPGPSAGRAPAEGRLWEKGLLTLMGLVV